MSADDTSSVVRVGGAKVNKRSRQNRCMSGGVGDDEDGGTGGVGGWMEGRSKVRFIRQQ